MIIILNQSITNHPSTFNVYVSMYLHRFSSPSRTPQHSPDHQTALRSLKSAQRMRTYSTRSRESSIAQELKAVTSVARVLRRYTWAFVVTLVSHGVWVDSGHHGPGKTDPTPGAGNGDVSTGAKRTYWSREAQL